MKQELELLGKDTDTELLKLVSQYSLVCPLHLQEEGQVEFSSISTVLPPQTTSMKAPRKLPLF